MICYQFFLFLAKKSYICNLNQKTKIMNFKINKDAVAAFVAGKYIFGCKDYEFANLCILPYTEMKQSENGRHHVANGDYIEEYKNV